MMQEYSHTRETETYRHLPRLARVSASYYLRLKRKTTTTPTEGQYAGDLVSNAGKREMGPKCGSLPLNAGKLAGLAVATYQSLCETFYRFPIDLERRLRWVESGSITWPNL
jgi:hypothetical protein